MAVYKCKMCGGELKVKEGNTVTECEFCGTTQTVPSAKDENIQTLFNRANNLRMKSEFDKAEMIYERIIQADSAQAEAYWGLILCKFGIEYVEDPTTFKRVPTCHRTSLDSVIADDDYKAAVDFSDSYQQKIYEAEAREIDRLQKEIIALSKKESPYDVFICYKETDDNGKRTQDSAIANDIYYQLTQEGFKVFYAAITLEDKLGSDYEPCIFAALNSAKVMLAIGTRPEYFTAVWVKNEWSRFLKMMKNDRSKLLIPCYRDMDAYELPEEFAHLQAQDMSKIGFINDVVRGIKKVIRKEEEQVTVTVKQTKPVSGTNTNAAPLLERAFLFLEDGKWSDANAYCEKVLDLEPKNAQAYLGKLMAELNVRKFEELKNSAEPFDEKDNYKKVIRFGDEKLVEALKRDIKIINERNEINRLTGIYNTAVYKMNSAKTKEEYKVVAHEFELLGDYKDAKELARQCYEKAEICRKDAIYDDACSVLDDSHTWQGKKTGITALEESIKKFQTISGWKDADEQIYACQRKIEEIKAKEEADRLEAERKAEAKRIADEKAAKKRKKIVAITTPIICTCIAFIIVLNTVIIPKQKFNKAMNMLDSGDYDSAYALLEEIGNTDAISSNKYDRAIALIDSGDYEPAYVLLNGLNYKDSETKLAEIKPNYYYSGN